MTIMLAVLSALGWVLAPLMTGLWWGERGRRMAAERWARLPDGSTPQARKLPRAPSTAEQLTRLPARRLPAAPSYTERVRAWLVRRAKEKGITPDASTLAAEADRLTRTTQATDG